MKRRPLVPGFLALALAVAPSCGESDHVHIRVCYSSHRGQGPYPRRDPCPPRPGGGVIIIRRGFTPGPVHLPGPLEVVTGEWFLEPGSEADAAARGFPARLWLHPAGLLATDQSSAPGQWAADAEDVRLMLADGVEALARPELAGEWRLLVEVAGRTLAFAREVTNPAPEADRRAPPGR